MAKLYYRGMAEQNDRPKIGRSARLLGVRPNIDINIQQMPVGCLACIIHESRVKNPETTTRYKLQRLDLNNSLFCLSVTGLSGEKIMVKKAEKRGQKTL